MASNPQVSNEAIAPNEKQKAVRDADMKGDRRTLVADSFIPAIMGVIYLALLFWFKTQGGYKPVRLVDPNAAA